MATTVRLRIKGERDTDRAFRAVNGQLTSLNQKLTNVGRTAKGFIGLLGGRAIVKAQFDVAQFDNRVGKLSRSLAISTEEFSKLLFAADRTGVGQRNLEVGVRTVIAATRDAVEGLKDYADAFSALKIDAERFERLPVTQKLEALADAFDELGDDPRRQDLALRLFGRRGGLNFLNLLENGSEGLRDLYDELERIGGVTDLESATKAEAAVDEIDNLKASFRGLARQVNDEVLPPLGEFLKWASEFESLTPGEYLSDLKDEFANFWREVRTGEFSDTIAMLFSEPANEAKLAIDPIGDLIRVHEQYIANSVTGAPVIRDEAAANRELAGALESVRLEKEFQLAGAKPKGPIGGPKKRRGGAGDGETTSAELAELTARLRAEAELAGSELTFILGDAIRAGAEEGGRGMRDVFRGYLSQMAADLAASGLVSLLSSLFPGAIASPAGGNPLFGALGKIFGFAQGGVVPGPRGAPQLALVHGKEEIFPPGSAPSSSSMVFNIDARGAAPGVEARIERAVADAVALARADRLSDRQLRRY